MGKPFTRRDTLLGSVDLAAALVASTVPAVADPNPDAALLALREPFHTTLAALSRASDLLSAHEETKASRQRGESPHDPKADRRLAAVEWLWNRRCAANRAVVDRMAAIPARTVGGVALKALASHHEDHLHRPIIASTMADLLAIGGLTDAA